ncbi:MAG: (2Fe-2S)-binding protein [Candidatus Hodarchaeales archaeon]
MSIKLNLTVNGSKHEITVEPNETLLDVLRNKLNIKSVKAACWQGDCGLCTVLLDGIPVKSCLILASEANNTNITTVEGLSEGPLLSELQESFLQHGAVQCGFCTSAFLLMGHHLISTKDNLTKSEIKHSLSGIICRCTGYSQIVDSIFAVHKKEKEK